MHFKTAWVTEFQVHLTTQLTFPQKNKTKKVKDCSLQIEGHQQQTCETSHFSMRECPILGDSHVVVTAALHLYRNGNVKLRENSYTTH